jgi:hypothetical protein
MVDGAFYAGGKARCIEFNFAGLWDTVPHLGWFNEKEKNYDFSIPDEMKFAAHANALNEHRGFLANFDARSILKSADANEMSNRIERGFLGAHSDIGGSYGTGDLSDTSLIWMIEQAAGNGLVFNKDIVTENGWDVVAEPLLHDSRNNIWERPFYGIDREVEYEDGSKVLQKGKKDVSGMTYKDTLQFISWRDGGSDGETAIAGDINLPGYCIWLNKHAYFKEQTVCRPSGEL